MKRAEYLYGLTDMSHLKDMGYVKTLEHKIEMSKILIAILQKVHYMKKDSTRINKSLDSQSFNQMLIDEVQGKI